MEDITEQQRLQPRLSENQTSSFSDLKRQKQTLETLLDLLDVQQVADSTIRLARVEGDTRTKTPNVTR